MGGHAIKDANILLVSQLDVLTAKHMMAFLTELPPSAFHPVGSTGKWPISNDADFAIDSNLYPVDKIHAILSSKLTGAAVFNFGTGVGSYAIPIEPPSPENLNPPKIQVDLMFTPNIEWAKFAYWSPDWLESDYKGAVRTLLLMGVATQVNVPGIDYFKNSGDSLWIRIGRTFDLNKGLRRIYQVRGLRKNGKGYLKNLKTTTLEEIQDQYPFIDVNPDDIVIDDPEEALSLMFNRQVSPHQVEDAESVIKLIHSSFSHEDARKIFISTANRAKSAVDKLKLPREIRIYL